MAPPCHSFAKPFSGLRPGLGSALGFVHEQVYEEGRSPNQGAAPDYFTASLRRGRANRLTSGGEAATQRAPKTLSWHGLVVFYSLGFANGG